jgi:hypothetical protein
MLRPYCLLWLVPLLSFAQTQTAGDGQGITVNAGAGLRHRAPVRYPKDSIVAGTVEIEARLNASGEVADARVVSGPEELRKEALWSVLQWHYGADAPTPVHISIRFDSSVTSVKSAPRRVTFTPDGPGVEDFLSGVLKAIEFSGLGAEAVNELRARLPFREGDPLQHSDLDRITDIVREFDDHLIATFTGQIAAPDAHRDLTVRIQAAAPATVVFMNGEDALPGGTAPKPAVKK